MEGLKGLFHRQIFRSPLSSLCFSLLCCLLWSWLESRRPCPSGSCKMLTCPCRSFAVTISVTLQFRISLVSHCSSWLACVVQNWAQHSWTSQYYVLQRCPIVSFIKDNLQGLQWAKTLSYYGMQLLNPNPISCPCFEALCYSVVSSYFCISKCGDLLEAFGSQD